MENLGTYDLGEKVSLIIPLHSFDTGALFAGSAVARIFRASDMVQVSEVLDLEPFPDSETPEQGKYYLKFDTSSLNPGSHLLLVDAVADAVPVSRCFSFYIGKKNSGFLSTSPRPFVSENDIDLFVTPSGLSTFEEAILQIPHIIRHTITIFVDFNNTPQNMEFVLRDTIFQEEGYFSFSGFGIGDVNYNFSRVELINVIGQDIFPSSLFSADVFLDYTESPYRKDTWHNVGEPGEPAYENGFRDFGGNWPGAGFFKSREDIVYLRGMIAGGGVDKTIFTLPEGYRPKESTSFPAVFDYSFGAVRVSPGGEVQIKVKSAYYYVLEGCCFNLAD